MCPHHDDSLGGAVSVAQAVVSQQSQAGVEEQRGQVAQVQKGLHQRDGPHGPITAELRWVQQQPCVHGKKVVEGHLSCGSGTDGSWIIEPAYNRWGEWDGNTSRLRWVWLNVFMKERISLLRGALAKAFHLYIACHIWNKKNQLEKCDTILIEHWCAYFWRASCGCCALVVLRNLLPAHVHEERCCPPGWWVTTVLLSKSWFLAVGNWIVLFSLKTTASLASVPRLMETTLNCCRFNSACLGVGQMSNTRTASMCSHSSGKPDDSRAMTGSNALDLIWSK